MGALDYIRFKCRLWTEVDSLPKWVYQAHDGYYEGFIEKYGRRPYGQEKVYVGDSAKYKIYYEPIAQGQIRDRYYAKVRS